MRERCVNDRIVHCRSLQEVETRDPRTRRPASFATRHSSLVIRHSSFVGRRWSPGCNRQTQAMTKPMQHSSLLRLWRDHAGAPLRATLIAVECPDKPRHFASMDELFAFLIAQADSFTPVDNRPEWD